MLAALAPSVVKVFDSAIQRWITPDHIKPSSIAEVIELGKLENAKLEMILKADSSGETYKWVEAIRKLQRPTVVISTLAAMIAHPDIELFGQLFQVIMWYLFGERFMMNQTQTNMKGKK